MGGQSRRLVPSGNNSVAGCEVPHAALHNPRPDGCSERVCPRGQIIHHGRYSAAVFHTAYAEGCCTTTPTYSISTLFPDKTTGEVTELNKTRHAAGQDRTTLGIVTQQRTTSAPQKAVQIKYSTLQTAGYNTVQPGQQEAAHLASHQYQHRHHQFQHRHHCQHRWQPRHKHAFRPSYPTPNQTIKCTTSETASTSDDIDTPHPRFHSTTPTPLA